VPLGEISGGVLKNFYQGWGGQWNKTRVFGGLFGWRGKYHVSSGPPRGLWGLQSSRFTSCLNKVETLAKGKPQEGWGHNGVG